MEASALHIYHSALPWSPSSSLIRRVYESQFAAEIKLMNAVDVAWDACIRIIPVYDAVRKVEFSHKGLLIAVLGWNRIKIFDALTGACVATYDTQRSVRTIAFSPDDSFLVSGLDDGTVNLLDAQTGNLIQTFRGHTGTITSVAFSPCGTMIASSAIDRTIRIWSVSSGSCQCYLEGHSDVVLAVSWSANGDQVISGSSDTTVRTWDISRKICSNIIRGHAGTVRSVASFRNFIASGSDDGTVKLCDLGSGDVLQTISTDHEIYSVQFSAHGDLLYTHASICDIGRKQHAESTSRDHGYHAKFSPDGTRVVSVSGNFVKIWKVKHVYPSSRVDGHSGEVEDIYFAPDGRLVASESDGDAKVWDTTSGECLFTFNYSDSGYDGIDSIRFSPNSAFIACPRHRQGSVWTIWDVRTRHLVERMVCDTSLIALSSDGARLASVSYQGIELWSVATGKLLAQLKLHDPQIICDIAFDVDGSSVFATTDDGYTDNWHISPANDDTSSLLPFVLILVQEKRSHSVFAPSQRYHYEEGDEWISHQDGMHVLWVPPDKRGSRIDIHGKKVAVGTKSGRAYTVDFSNTHFLPS
jgi:WD40 repeat protein